MGLSRLPGFAKYLATASVTLAVSAITHPGKPLEIDGSTGKLLGRYNSDDEMGLAAVRRNAEFALGTYDEVGGDTRRFEDLLRSRTTEDWKRSYVRASRAELDYYVRSTAKILNAVNGDRSQFARILGLDDLR